MFEFGIKDIIDITLVAVMLYYVYRLMRESRSANVFIGLLMFFVIWLVVSQMIEMKLLGAILDKLVSVGVLALIILFQQEIRKFLYDLGARQSFGSLKRLFGRRRDQEADKTHIMPIVMACMSMSKNLVGALIVVERITPLDDIVDGGETIDADINQRLIENIFFKNSPLHDGAMVISQKRIKRAGCLLPVSHDTNIPKDLGLRHRAAMAVSQESDALAIIVSEETGNISCAMQGKFRLAISGDELEGLLTGEI